MALVLAVGQLCNFFFFFNCICPFLFYTFLKSGVDKSMEWSTIPACPSLMCFFNRGNTEGTNSSKILYLMFCACFVICQIVSGLKQTQEQNKKEWASLVAYVKNINGDIPSV